MYDFTTTQINNKYVDEHYTDHDEKEIELNQFENRDVPCGGTHAQGTSGSKPTHGELLKSCRPQSVQEGVHSVVPLTSTEK
jgi:hypothetical protein